MIEWDAFLSRLPDAVESQVDRAVLIVAFRALQGALGSTTGEIADRFEQAHLPRPNVTRLALLLSKDPRVSFRGGEARPLRAARVELLKHFPDLEAPSAPEPIIASELLSSAPFIDAEYLRDLEMQAELYKALHVQENSMRRLIEAVLSRTLGSDWWNQAASAPMKRKHEDRLSKERNRKWLPARSESGPLYSIDWSDLISLIRKYEADFLPFIGEIDFMHRFSDLGLLRHVIAHNGFIEDQSDISRTMIFLRDWNKQVSGKARSEFS
jgi:hypothetical protein